MLYYIKQIICQGLTGSRQAWPGRIPAIYNGVLQ